MSKYNPLYHSIWTDSQFEEYSIEKKLLFIFLLTNHLTHKSGIYKITIKQISFYTDLDKYLINELINELIEESKIKFDSQNGIIFIKNLYKYQKGMIKNRKVMLLSLKKHYDLIESTFWQDFFDIYKDDDVINFFINEIINGSLMIHQLYINNNINNNKNINKDNNKDEPKRKKVKQFKKPLIEEIREYCNEILANIDPQGFFDYYESNGWKVGKNPMKDWKATVRSWKSRGNTELVKKTKPSKQDAMKQVFMDFANS